jgi:hypothetical protein
MLVDAGEGAVVGDGVGGLVVEGFVETATPIEGG